MSRLESVFQLPFDQYQRYRLAAEIMAILEKDRVHGAVLEVGGYPPKLKDFLPENQITIVDQVDDEAPGYEKAEATALPFPENNFSAAISLDTIEHIDPQKRGLFISELCRVAKSFVIIAAPFKSDAIKAADHAIFEFIKDLAGYEHEFLKEHIELELPDLADALAQMTDLGLEVQVIPSGRLDRWLFMMAAYYTLDADPDLQPSLPLLMEAYNRAYYEHDKAEPAYRHFLVGSYDKLGGKRDRLAKLASTENSGPVDERGVSMVFELARTIALKKKDDELSSLREELKAKDGEINALTDHVQALSDFQQKVKSLPVYSFYEKHIKPRIKP